MTRVSSPARQMQLLRFIRGYQLAKGYSPSFREMAIGLGISPRAKQTISTLLDQLQRRGLARRLYNRTRSIEVLAKPAVPFAPDGAPLFPVPGFGERD